MLYSDSTKDIENLQYKIESHLACKKCVEKVIYVHMVLVLWLF